MTADFYCFAGVNSRNNLVGQAVWLICHREVTTAELKSYLSNVPVETLLTKCVHISGCRWPIETCFEEVKQELGLGGYQVRRWVGWHLHCTYFHSAIFIVAKKRTSIIWKRNIIMGSIRISLFGKFCLRNDEQIVADLGVQKAQELFCYLLLNRRQPQVREKLAVLLWENCSIAKSKRYLRQTLWQLQSTLNEINGKSLLFVEPDWMQVNPETDFWLDVDRFEHAYVLAQGHRGRDLDAVQAEALKEAVHLYRGDLLENCYQDWCLFERERLQNMFLSVLDKLMSYCESQHDYENGILYGMKILRCDYARERTHRQLMRLRFLARDRTGALRQFQLCAKALDNELGVKPSHHTIALYDQLRQAKPNVQLVSLETGVESPVPSPLSSETLDHLNHLKATLASVQQQIESEIEAVKLALNGRW